MNDDLRALGARLDRQRLALHALATCLESTESGGTPLLALRIDRDGRITSASAQAARLIQWRGAAAYATDLLHIVPVPGAGVAQRQTAGLALPASQATAAFQAMEKGACFEATISATGASVLVVVAEANGDDVSVLLWPMDAIVPGIASGIASATAVPADDVRLLARKAAHDFNNILSTMVGYAELAMMLSNEPRIAHYLSEIYTGGKRGQGVVNALQQQLTNGASASNPAAPAETALGHVLVVDDESSVADLLAEILKSAGYAVSATYSPDEALRLFRRDPHGFDLLITDQTMPEMTGLALAQEMTRIRADLPFVLCTGWGDTIQVQQSAQTAVRNFVAKPVDADVLVDLVGKLIGPNAGNRDEASLTHLPGAALARNSR